MPLNAPRSWAMNRSPVDTGPAGLTDAPVAQLDRVLDSDSKGHRFESCRVRQFPFVHSAKIFDKA